MITVKELKKDYKTQKRPKAFLRDFFAREHTTHEALKGISFEVKEGELVGFIGPNGAGKTTTMKILAGILYPTSGEVKVLNHQPFKKEAAFLKQISFVMGQKNQLIWELSPRESYRLNKEIYEVPDSVYNKHLGDLVELLNAQEFIDKPVRGLSLGQRMRAELIAALIHKPKVLYLDEPTIGLDIFAHTTIINFIREYQAKFKATIILTSHYMKDIQSLAKRVILIDKGQILYDGKLDDLILSYSREKALQIVLKNPLSTGELKSLGMEYDYQFPLLKIRAEKEKLLNFMAKKLEKLEFSDFTLEDEPIEEVIKKAFGSR
jgi:ABC-2 type transport system ATP-binding protein